MDDGGIEMDVQIEFCVTELLLKWIHTRCVCRAE